jgi:hypothetical protein
MNIDDALDRAISMVEYLKAAKDRGFTETPDNVWSLRQENVPPGAHYTIFAGNMEETQPHRVLYAVCFNEFRIHSISFGTSNQLPYGGCLSSIFDPRLNLPPFEFTDSIPPHCYCYVQIEVENLRSEPQTFEMDLFAMPVDRSISEREFRQVLKGFFKGLDARALLWLQKRMLDNEYGLTELQQLLVLTVFEELADERLAETSQ